MSDRTRKMWSGGIRKGGKRATATGVMSCHIRKRGKYETVIASIWKSSSECLHVFLRAGHAFINRVF